MMKTLMIGLLLLTSCAVAPPSYEPPPEPGQCMGMQPMCKPGMHPVCICGQMGNHCYWLCSG